MARANLITRFLSAERRVPHQTGWGTGGFLAGSRLVGFFCQGILAVTIVARQKAPAILLIAWNIFR